MKARVLVALFLITAGLTGCISGKKNFLYVNGTGTNEVFGFSMHSDGTLTALATPNFTTGSQPSSTAIHPPGDFIYIANFGGNNVTLLDINHSNGQLVVPPTNSALPPVTPPNFFDAGTHPVAAAVSPTSAFLYVLNQGSDDISAFTIDPGTGNLGGVAGAPFTLNTGTPTVPQSLTITPNGNNLYVTNPAQGTISAFSINAQGVLTAVAGSPFAVGPAGSTPVWATIDASSHFLYAADSTNNVVRGFTIQSGGALAPMSTPTFAAGTKPSFMAVNPQGTQLFVSNATSNDVSAFVIDPSSGALAPVSGSPVATGGRTPGFVLATGSFLYVADQGSNDIAAFALGADGSLTPVKNSPFGVPVSPTWINAVSE